MSDPKSSETTGYHLFLRPEGKLATDLGECIRNLAQEYGGPVFQPHVTLLAEISENDEEKVISIATTLANQLQSFKIILEAVGMEEAFFRALYKAVIPSDELSEAHAKALQAFGMKDAFPYMPHLSLFYGNTSAETKTKMAQSLELPDDLSFTVDKIYVYKTHGPATEWLEVAALDLQ